MTIHDLSAVEQQTIRDFIQDAADDGLLSGRVLDLGCGKQPYRKIVTKAKGRYHPFDRAHFGGNVSVNDIGTGYGMRDRHGHQWDAVMTTQVIQYIEDPGYWLEEIHGALAPGGALVMTYPASWPVLRDHLWNFTKLGMDRLLEKAGFTVGRHDLRHGFDFQGFSVPAGYGVIATA